MKERTKNLLSSAEVLLAKVKEFRACVTEYKRAQEAKAEWLAEHMESSEYPQEWEVDSAQLKLFIADGECEAWAAKVLDNINSMHHEV